MVNLVDFHAHVLANIDDGSKSDQQSIEMLELIKTQNIDTVVATPHFYAYKTSISEFLKARDKSVQALSLRLKNQNKSLNINLLLGAEVAYYDNISANEDLQKLCIQGTNTILIELPFCKFDRHIYSEIALISSKGFLPVIAHCERYLKFNKIDIYHELINCGAYIQANANFFIGTFTKNKAMKLLKNNLIHVLGSDCHNMSKRKPNLDLALQVVNKNKLDIIERINFNTSELLEGAKVIDL